MSASVDLNAEQRDNSEDVSEWMSAVKAYVKETNASCVDLSNKGIGFSEVESILELLSDSEVTELNLKGIRHISAKRLFNLLKETKIKKVELDLDLELSSVDGLSLLRGINDCGIEDLGSRKFLVKEMIPCQIVSQLWQSPLRRLNLEFNSKSDAYFLSVFANGLPSTSFTSLRIFVNLYEKLDAEFYGFASLFSKLPFCEITNLDLNGVRMNNDMVEELSRNLENSKLEALSLCRCAIKDSGLDILAEGLVKSNVSKLDLSFNEIHGSNNFMHYLKNSKLKVLDLSDNEIRTSQIFAFPDFLKGSSLESLDLSVCSLGDELAAQLIRSLKATQLTELILEWNCLGIKSISEFAAVLKYTNLEEVNLSDNDLSAEACDMLNGCVKNSKLKYIGLKLLDEEATISCLRFLEGTGYSSLLEIMIENSSFSEERPEVFSQMLIHTTFTHFYLTECKLNGVFPLLAFSLEYTSITVLSLYGCMIQDKGVRLLAEHLKETKVMELDLVYNEITSEGARALAVHCPHTSVIHLDLGSNKIENDGLQILAELLSRSLITVLCVDHNPGDRVLLIDKVLLKNQVLSHEIVAFFKQIFPENGSFRLEECIQNRNRSDFIENCMQFYKRVDNQPQPSVVSILLREASLPCSREVLATLLDNFPQQLGEFIGTWIDADTEQHVKFLERAEELGVLKVVEYLLELPSLYTIDKDKSILHPYVSSLLLKYKQQITLASPPI